MTWRIVGLGVLALTGTCQANVLVNGSFEEPVQEPHFSTPRGPGDSLTGWVIAGGGVDHAYEAWDAADGVRSLSLNWVGATTLTQVVTTEVGGTYDLTFAMAAEIFGGPQFRTMDVTWNGLVVGSFVFEYTGQGPSDMGWEYHGLELQGTGLDELGFVSTTVGNYGPGLDDVSLALSTPECPADLDEDGTVGASDLAELLSEWGVCRDCAADLDGSGTVDAGDLAQLLAAWGDC